HIHSKTRYSRVLDIVRHLIRHDGASLSIFIVEDLHWLDEASEDFVAMLVDAVTETRSMLIFNYRPSYTAQWMRSTHFVEVALGELGNTDIDALLTELIGSQPEMRNIRQRLAERSGGNPFFAEELVRSLVENGMLIGTTGDYILGTQFHGDGLPVTVEAVVAARLDRLASGEKAIVQVAAIIGKEFPLAILQEVVDTQAMELEALLERLRQADILKELTALDGRQFAFRHPLIQEVAYASQLKARRSTLHASVANALEIYH